nr:hypothetical protein [Candidatus Enterovibrio luxaltus]
MSSHLLNYYCHILTTHALVREPKGLTSRLKRRLRVYRKGLPNLL